MSNFYKLLKEMESEAPQTGPIPGTESEEIPTSPDAPLSEPESQNQPQEVDEDQINQIMNQIPGLLTQLEQLLQQLSQSTPPNNSAGGSRSSGSSQQQPQPQQPQQPQQQVTGDPWGDLANNLLGIIGRQPQRAPESFNAYVDGLGRLIEDVEYGMYFLAESDYQNVANQMGQVIAQLKQNFSILSNYTVMMRDKYIGGAANKNLGKDIGKGVNKGMTRASQRLGADVGQGIKQGLEGLDKEVKWEDVYNNMREVFGAILSSGWYDLGFKNWIKIYPGQVGSGLQAKALNPYNEVEWQKYVEDQWRQGRTQWRVQINKTYFLKSSSPKTDEIKYFDPFQGYYQAATTVRWIKTTGSDLFEEYVDKYPDQAKSVVRRHQIKTKRLRDRRAGQSSGTPANATPDLPPLKLAKSGTKPDVPWDVQKKRYDQNNFG